MLLRDWVIRYADGNLGISQPGIEQLAVAARRFEVWAGHSIQTSELDSNLVAGFLRWSLESGAAPATVNSKRRCLLTLWRAAHAAGLAPPVAVIRPAREPQHAPDSWSLEQVGQLLRYCRTLKGRIDGIPRADYFVSMFLTLYDSGERINAVRSCRCCDFDPSAGALLIRAEHHKCRRDRLCRLSPETVDALRSSVAPAPRRSLIWPWPQSRRHFFRCLRRVIEDAGLPASKGGMGLTHRLRRTSGSLVEAAGGDGSKHLGNSRRVFEAHYLDPRVGDNGQLSFLPRPRF